MLRYMDNFAPADLILLNNYLTFSVLIGELMGESRTTELRLVKLQSINQTSLFPPDWNLIVVTSLAKRNTLIGPTICKHLHNPGYVHVFLVCVSLKTSFFFLPYCPMAVFCFIFSGLSTRIHFSRMVWIFVLELLGRGFEFSFS